MSGAVVFDEYGEPEVLHVVDGPPPRPGPGQVRVRVHAAGVQPFDSLFRRGVTRQWMPATFPQRLGSEFAGVVDAVGPAVTEPAVGAEVLGWASVVCYAEHVVVDTTNLVTKPAGLQWPAAGVLSASGQTAMTALRQLGVEGGATVLIHGAAGGVGGFAVQLATLSGARVIGTARPANHAYLEELGAIPVAYGDGLTERIRTLAPHGVDAALLTVSTVDAIDASVALVVDRERIGSVAFSPVLAERGIRRLSTERSPQQLSWLAGLVAAGQLRVSIAEELPLEQAARAHRLIEGGHVRGKLVLAP
jgi:enoyl reductase